MRFLKLTVAYDGTAFAGWQVQPNERTVQASLEQAVTQITSEEVRVVASGRTDAGVHALGQAVSLSTNSDLANDVLLRAINANTPHDLVVLDVADAPDGFHAIRDAVGKRYRYVIQDGPLTDVFSRSYAWHVPQTLDADAMRTAAKSIVGRHDFKSFEAAGSERKTSIRTVTDLTVERIIEKRFQRVLIEIAADGFLYNMVRNIVGTLVEVGRGNQSAEWTSEVLEAKDRQVAGPTAPAHGLFLIEVDYDEFPASCEPD